MAEAPEKRIRTLTEKGQTMVEEQCRILKKKVDKACNEVEDVLVKSGLCENDFKKVREVEHSLNVKFKEFCIVSEDYKKYLNRQNTGEASDMLKTFDRFENKCFAIVRKTSNELESTKFDLLETLSHVSNSSSFQREKIQREKAKLELIKKEAELKKQKTDIETKINIVQQEKEIIEAEADLSDNEKSDLSLDVPVSTKEQLTSDYIINHTPQNLSNTVPHPPISVYNPVSTYQPPALQPSSMHVPPKSVQELSALYGPPNSVPQPSALYGPPNSVPQPSALYGPPNSVPQMFIPSNPAPPNPPPPVFMPPTPAPQMSNTSAITDFSKFLLRKDFLLTRFTNFDDRPESFNSWTSSFRSLTTELGVTPFEEMDLLVKWLGPESSKFARTLRSANTHDPSLGLKRIWDRLHDRYGRPEMVEHALKKKVHLFPNLTNKDHGKLYDLVDILTEIECAMADPQYSLLLSYFNSSTGVLPIVSKLPASLQDKWTTQASGYKKRNYVPFPPFSFFVNFIRDMCDMRNDPGLIYQQSTNPQVTHSKPRPISNVTSRKADISTPTPPTRCPIHNAGHTLNECRGFKRKSLQERQRILQLKNLCFRCCASQSHMSKNCTADIKCEICGNSRHVTAMHIDRHTQKPPSHTAVTAVKTTLDNGGESTTENDSGETVNACCTQLCGNSAGGRSCGKIVLVEVFSTFNPEKTIRAYATIDDQSNRTLVSPNLIEQLGISGNCKSYTLTSCSGVSTFNGRCVNGLCVKSVDGSTSFDLPEVIECDSIPSDSLEILTSDVADSFPHLQRIASYLPPFDRTVNVELLIGRDLPDVHHVRDQITGNKGQPFAQLLSLGWVIIGEVCIGKVHRPKEVNVNKTHILNDGRCTTFPLYQNNISVKDNDDSLFVRTPFDNKIGQSVEDRKFLTLMDEEFRKDSDGYWSAPLPFKDSKPEMPNNYSQAWKRALILNTSLQRDSHKKEHFLAFMSKVLASGAAEVAPSDIPGECWYLPLFGVYNSKKPDQIRGVFDSSAVYKNISLNSVLMSGPDLTNNLVGILMRFRENAIAISGDIQQMFYAFRVHVKHRDYLRFFWYADNDFQKPLIQYRMKAHVFGNTPSPAVATYGLHKASDSGDSDVRKFVYDNFYVDDGLTSLPTEAEAVTLMKKTQATLKENGNIRLHKIISNSVNVMKSFPSDDLGSDLKELNHSTDMCNLPVQHSLGMLWDLNSDMFVFKISNTEKPCTRRGLLSTLNSVFDPVGFISPVTISGKILHRELVPSGCDWDEPLSEDHVKKWQTWLDSLHSINDYRVPRMIVSTSVSQAHCLDVHVFSDASEHAVAAVAYLRVIDRSGEVSIGFLMGKSKLAPLKGHTIPRLELCAAVLATEVGEAVCDHLNIPQDQFHYYTDSRIILGYICNNTRRFFVYVYNRVEKIHKVSSPAQWSYVSTDKNPADIATRYSHTALTTSLQNWIAGPQWLKIVPDETKTDYPLIEPESDKEIRQEVVSSKTRISTETLVSNRFCKNSTWNSLVKAISTLRRFLGNKARLNSEAIEEPKLHKESENVIIQLVQQESYSREIENLKSGKPLPRNSRVSRLDPFLDSSGVLRVGGRLKRSSELSLGEKNPILIPNQHYIAKLLVLHYHEIIHHQGRHLTAGAIRAAGYWIPGCKRLIYTILSACVKCQRLRGNFVYQKMADLPEERLMSCPPFTYVGVYCFGPWSVVTRRTRGGSANSKRWAVLFTCLSCRGIHIEVIEEMSTSSFINALRRFTSIRGKVKELYSDRGTNFVGGTRELGIGAIFVENLAVKSFLKEQGAIWKFNKPFSSHMGGAWERLIGVIRRIIDSILLDAKHTKLTHEVLCTFMAETTAIVNARPLVPLSTDPEAPCILSPAVLLTQKNH
ncbi:uncharacterized protein LOC134265202 [Saccostrea cucullata]|uniref:uncharacterized protein LOC134265202 n=1 Tax=Saccostrea cuccullata TaxID=36930 RepID=UPI002ED22BA9